MQMSVLFAYSRRLVLIILIGVVGGIAHDGVRVQILSINDFHGNLEPPAGSDAKMRETEDPLLNDLGQRVSLYHAVAFAPEG
jgi:hypothetical protein